MTISEIREIVKTRTRRGTADDALILSLLQIINDDLYGFDLSCFGTVSADLAMVTDQNYVDMPSDFRKLVGIKITLSADNFSWLLPVEDEVSIESILDTRSTSRNHPTSYAEWDRKFYLSPYPDDTYTYNVLYYCTSPTLTASSTSLISTIYGDKPLILGAMKEVYETFDQHDKAVLYGNKYNEKKIAFKASQTGPMIMDGYYRKPSRRVSEW